MEKIGVVGLGLIGCSIARALHSKYEIAGVDGNRETVNYCLENGIINLQGLASLRGAKIVFVCVPISAVERTVRQVALVVGDDAVITDTASVKGCFSDMPARFVGGHPMAGSEQSGARAAFKEMFENAFWILTGEKDGEDVKAVAEVVSDMGARPVYMTSEEHDRAVADISHLPHMVAYALVNTVLAPRDNYGELASGGFLDTTRIASSAPDFWLAVTKANRDNLLRAMDAFEAEFKKLRTYIEEENGVRTRAYFSDGRRRRDGLMTGKRYRSEYEIYVPVRDEVGAIGKIATLIGKRGLDLKSIRIDNSREGVGGALRLGFRKLSDYEQARELLKENDYL